MRASQIATAGAASLVLLLAACGSSGPSSSSSSTKQPAGTTVASAVDPNAPEVVAPGDIPDNQAFVTYERKAGGYSVKVPEGWARSESNGVVTFTDKYNSIQITSATAKNSPTVGSVTSLGLSDVAKDPSFKLGRVSLIHRKAGTGVRATYEIGSPPNSVTGKKALLAVERYVFFHNGRTVILTLSGAKGADNVDPWRIVSNSLTWA